MWNVDEMRVGVMHVVGLNKETYFRFYFVILENNY